LGTSLPTDGPGLSACIKYILEAPAIGRIASIKTNTPMPPIQWEKLLHIKIECGRTSTSDKIVAPVVVKPDTISNRASTGLEKYPLIKKGIAPQILRTIQQNATAT